MAKPPFLLYSTNTALAFGLSSKYYNDTHWVWCSPFYRPRTPSAFRKAPPSAIPGEIHDRLFADVSNGDSHSPLISQNRVGLARGAKEKLDAGVIDQADFAEILSTIKNAEVADFRPLLYVIPYSAVSGKVTAVPAEMRAHLLSEEYIIKALLGTEFDALQLR